MKKNLLLFAGFLFIIPVLAQPSVQKKTNKDAGINISAGILVPLGNFAYTHVAGIGIGISPSYHTVGLISKIKVGFTYDGGAAYYLGKKETVSGHPYTYPGYFFLHAFAGALFIPAKKTEVSLTAGPALGIYNHHTQFNIGSKAEFIYHFNNRLLMGPGLIFMKEKGADALWAASLKAAMSF